MIIYACFIDYPKAFDCGNNQKMIEILRKTEIDEQYLRVISELYGHQTATVKIDQKASEDIWIWRVVVQVYVLPSLLFNLCSD